MSDSSTAISAHPANRGALLGLKSSAILSSCAGGALYGLAAGIIGGVQDAMVKAEFFPDDSKNVQALLSGILTASLLLGALLGCFAGVACGNKYGRRVSFRLTGLNAIVMSVLLALVPSFPLIVIVRAMLGVSVGFVTALCPWYVTDAIPPATRGSIGTIFQINICAFILVGEIINYAFHPDASDDNIFISEWKWRVQLGLSALPGLALLLVGFFMHESPAYLQSLNERDSLLTTGDGLTPVASAGLSDDAELQRPDVSNVNGKAEGWRDLFSGGNWKYVAVALILSSSQQLSGINAVIFYAPGIFKDADMSNPLVLTIAVVGTWNLLSVFISFALVDRLGKRALMLGALAVMAVGSGLMAAAYQYGGDNKGPLAITALLLFVGAFECGPGPLFFILAVESCDRPQLRDTFLKFTQGSCWVFAIMVTFGFPVLNDALGSAGTFLIFCVVCVLSLGLIWWKVPEPKSDAMDSSVQHGGRSRSTSQTYQKL